MFYVLKLNETAMKLLEYCGMCSLHETLLRKIRQEEFYTN